MVAQEGVVENRPSAGTSKDASILSSACSKLKRPARVRTAGYRCLGKV